MANRRMRQILKCRKRHSSKTRYSRKEAKLIKRSKLANKKLCKEYPFFQINEWHTSQPFYGYTFLDDMPIGWQTCFGMQMAKELKQALIEADYLDTYEILQVKEKYGQLRWYDAGAPKKANDIINKYCFISEHVCIQCGSTHATQMDLWGWISPICEDCFNRMKKSRAAEGYGKDIEWPVENAPYEIPDYYTEQRRSSDGSFETYQIDITETKQMLNKRYEKRRKNWKKGKIRSATKMAAKSQVKENTCE